MKRKVLLLLLVSFTSVLFAQTVYHLHDKIKVKWGSTWWDAEIIDVRNDQYKIHYDNYGSNWDEWVKNDRIQAKATPGNSNHQVRENNSTTAITDGKFSVGDKVEAWSAGKWYAASVVSIGTGNYNGYYYIHFTDYSEASNQWLNASSVKKITAKTNTANVSPRDGKYKMLSYGSNPANPIYLGYFILKGGSYSYFNAANQLLGSGNYSYDNSSKNIKWNSGPFKSNEWGGSFEITREGKTHIIRLRSGTIGTNSVDTE